MKDEYKIDLKRMLKALYYALKYPSKGLIYIAQVVRHGSGPSLKYTYNKLLETREGGEIAYTREEISDYMPTIGQRPDGSVGKACAEYFKWAQMNVVKVSRKRSNEEWIEAKHPYNWMARRYRDTHDIWHILTGYPTTVDGEMCITMFSFAQTRALSWLAISLSILFFVDKPMRLRKPTLQRFRMVYEAYQRGKNAKFLLAEDYDKLLSENLHDARKRLNIKPPRFFVDRSSNLLKL